MLWCGTRGLSVRWSCVGHGPLFEVFAAFFSPGTECPKPDCTPSHPFVNAPPNLRRAFQACGLSTEYSFATILVSRSVSIRATSGQIDDLPNPTATSD